MLLSGMPLSYIITTILFLLLLLLCAIYGIHRKHLPAVSVVLELLVVILYGFSLENIMVNDGRYLYGQFPLSIADTPLEIGIGWAVIVCASMWLTDSLSMPEWARPFTDTFLALLIDIGMDAVAIRDSYLRDGELQGMWNWPIGLDEQWFGVPFGNFIGWWLIVFLISLMLRFGRGLYRFRPNTFWAVFYPLMSAVVALFVFLPLINALFVQFGETPQIVLLVMLLLSLSITALTWRGFRRSLSLKQDLPVFLVPAVFHLLFLGILLIRRMHVETPALLAVSLGIILLEIVLHLFISRRSKRAEPIT